MDSRIYLRMSGYVFTFVMHIVNLGLMQRMRKEDIGPVEEVDLNVFQGTMFRYFTCWTVGLQIFYASLGLFCDALILRNSNNKKYKLPKQLNAARNIIFAAIVWPCSLLVATIFWGLFNYDRSLIFPIFLDKVISKTTNHILHTAIIPIALWEVVFRQRTEPRTHWRNLGQLTAHMGLYLCVLYYTYYERGLWLYPMFEVTYGTIHFLLIHVYIGVLLIFYYYLQWFLNRAIHGRRISKKIK